MSDTGLWDTGFQFGDWLDPTAPPDRPADAKADKGVVATACLYRSAHPRRTAEIVGRADDAEHFGALADRTREAFTQHYLSQTARSSVMHPPSTRWPSPSACSTRRAARLAGERLAKLVADGGYRIKTGFAGTPFVTDALASTGHLDDAYQLLLQRENPSWLYPVTMGRRRSGNAGTRCCPTAPSTQAR